VWPYFERVEVVREERQHVDWIAWLPKYLQISRLVNLDLNKFDACASFNHLFDRFLLLLACKLFSLVVPFKCLVQWFAHPHPEKDFTNFKPPALGLVNDFLRLKAEIAFNQFD
jgi:hypothetical protein